MTAGTEPTRVWPTLVADLHPSENLIVWSYRSWAMAIQAGGDQRWRMLRYEYRRQFGVGAGEGALDRFSVMMRQIGGHARAPMQYHMPCCPCLGEQEVGVMSLVAACQAREWALARRIASCLVDIDAVGSVIAAASGVADLMGRYLAPLPLRLGRNGNTQAAKGHAMTASKTVAAAFPDVTIH